MHRTSQEVLQTGAPTCTRRVVIGRNVWIGSNARLLPRVTIGDDAVVGAGSLVAKDVPARAVAGGPPARVVRSLPE